MQSSDAKDNANPTIIAVDHKSAQSRKHRLALEYEELAALSISDAAGKNNYCERTSAQCWRDRRILLQGLAGVSQLGLLRQHLHLPKDIAQELSLQDEPLFVPYYTNNNSSSSSSIPTPTTGDAPAAARDEEATKEAMTVDEIFEIIRNIQDPEHPLTLEQLGVVSRDQIQLDNNNNITVHFTPTVPHCSMATLIGLAVTVKLQRSLPPTTKLRVAIEPGTHASEHAISKQLNDKERVCAALENPHLVNVVHACIRNGMMQ